MSSLKRIVLPLLFSMLSIACIVQTISGPSIGTPLQQLSYSLRIHGDPCRYVNAFSGTGVLLIDIPSDWQVERASFSAVFGGVPVSGDGIQPSSCPVSAPAPPPSGFTRVCLTTPAAYGMNTSDTVDATVTLRAGSRLGLFPLQFWAGALHQTTPDRCVQPSPTVYPVTIAPSSQVPLVPTLHPWGLASLSFALLGAGLFLLRATCPKA